MFFVLFVSKRPRSFYQRHFILFLFSFQDSDERALCDWLTQKAHIVSFWNGLLLGTTQTFGRDKQGVKREDQQLARGGVTLSWERRRMWRHEGADLECCAFEKWREQNQQVRSKSGRTFGIPAENTDRTETHVGNIWQILGLLFIEGKQTLLILK